MKPLFAAALIASVTLKIWTIAAARETSSADADIETRLQLFLVQAGFSTQRENGISGFPVVSGQAGSCRVLLASVAAQGWHRDLIFSKASNDNEVAFLFKGQIFSDQPRWKTWTYDKIYKLKRVFDRNLRAERIIAMVISRSCAVDKKLWAEQLSKI